MKRVEDSELVHRLLEGVRAEIEATQGARLEGVSIYQGVCEGDEGAQKLYRFRTADRFRARADAPVALRVTGTGREPCVYEATVRSYTEGSLLLAIAHADGETIPNATLEFGVEGLVLRKVQELLKPLAVEAPQGGSHFHRDTAARALKGPTRPNPDLLEEVTEIPRELTPDQQDAFRRALSAPVTYIWGPAGTGKTTTLGAVIHRLFVDYKRVLVVAHTNQAVDGMVAAVYKRLSRRDQPAKLPEGSVVRLGAIARRSLSDEFGGQIRFDTLVESGRRKMEQRLREMQSDLQDVERAIWSASHRSALVEHQKNLEREYGELLDRARGEAPSIAVRLLGSVMQKVSPSVRESCELQAEIALVEAGLEEVGKRLAEPLQARSEVALTELLEKQKDLSGGVELLQGFVQDIRTHTLSRARIVACTASKAVLSFAELGDFDAVVIDEASMMPLPMTYLMAGLSKGSVVVAGDFRQLPPIARSQSDVAKKLYATSVFESSGIERSLASGDGHSELATLTSQFRSHPEILRLFNERFYGGRLHSAFTADSPLEGHGAFIERLQKQRVLMVDTAGLAPFGYYVDKSKANLVHALVIARIVECLGIKRPAVVGDIGVISPYRPQVGLVHSILRESALDAATACGTVHRFQGDERSTIILDLTESLPHRVGAFLSGASVGELSARLLNVALSRAQHFLVIVADCAHLEHNLGPEHLVFSLLMELRAAGAVVDAREILADDVCSDEETSSASAVVQMFSESDIYPALVADLVEAQRSVAILSDGIDARGAAILKGVLAPRIREGVRVTVLIGAACNPATVSELQAFGVHVSASRADGRLAGGGVIDDRIAWTCSGAPLSSEGEGAPRIALRVVSPCAASFMRRSLQ